MVQLHAGSNLPQPHPTASASLGVFGGAAERFQPCFTLATKNIEHEGLGANSASLTVLGALDQLGKVCGDLDGHGMASRGLQSTRRCFVSSGNSA